MLRPFVADLHLHTVLSPCADYRMVPELIVERAVEAGLDLIAVTDHNSGENAEAMISAAGGSGVTVLPGMEVESREGVHVITLFDDPRALKGWQEVIYAALPPRENVEKLFGAQLVVDASGQLLRVNRRLLITGTDLSLDEVVDRCRAGGGLAVPAHVDRPANGLIGVLGLLPPGLEVAALEVSPRLDPEDARGTFPGLAGCTLIRSSDAHSLEYIGRGTTTFLMGEPSVDEILMALRRARGRGILSS